jgi:hypothetical protein
MHTAKRLSSDVFYLPPSRPERPDHRIQLIAEASWLEPFVVQQFQYFNFLQLTLNLSQPIVHWPFEVRRRLAHPRLVVENTLLGLGGCCGIKRAHVKGAARQFERPATWCPSQEKEVATIHGRNLSVASVSSVSSVVEI